MFSRDATGLFRLRLLTPAAALISATLALGCFAVHNRPPAPPVSLAPSASPALSTPGTEPRPLYVALTAEEAKAYVGDAVCAPCHTAICRRYGATGHARSLSLVTPAADGRYFQKGQTIRDTKADTTYQTTVQNGACIQVSNGAGGKENLPAQVALGSGRNGLTYLGRDEAKQWMVLRLSYYTHKPGWDFTPGQEPSLTSFADPKGQALSGKQVEDCLSCHATILPTTAGDPDLHHARLGVGCESCHGPGRAHVESMRGTSAGKKGGFVPLEDLKTASATRIMQICGGCHSTLFSSGLGAPTSGDSVSRFASTALAQSKCFQSSGTLSCVTCHDPHTEVATNRTAYEAACLRCHSGSQPVSPSASAPHVCKINPRSGCIGCHMPTQTNSTFPHTLFHNHWIKVWPTDKQAKSG